VRTKTFVFDVNILVSAFIVGSYSNSLAFDKALETGRVVCTHAIWTELADVFLREKFDKYHPFEDRVKFLSYLEAQLLQWPQPVEKIKVCRDPKDDKYLELAVSAKAYCIITGDKDLLVLNPFENIPIISSAEFLTVFS
jgi:putative PIN family toxin of toxin-antitoxin system